MVDKKHIRKHYGLKKVVAWAVILLIVFTAAPVPAKADTGPKPSITVEFSGFEDEECYVTILSKSEHAAWRSIFDGDLDEITEIPEGAQHDCQCSFDIWKKFVTYQDSDGMHFLQMVWDLKDAKEIRWGYFPPQIFKVLLYFPETDSFVAGAVTERKAFYSVYSVNKSGTTELKDSFELEEKYDFSDIIISVVLRLLTTLVIEILIALAFGYRTKRQILTITAVNLATQVLLNGYLAVREYFQGEGWGYLATYIFVEIIVLIVEAIIYALKLTEKDTADKKVPRAVIYAVVANVCSVFVGTIITMY